MLHNNYAFEIAGRQCCTTITLLGLQDDNVVQQKLKSINSLKNICYKYLRFSQNEVFISSQSVSMPEFSFECAPSKWLNIIANDKVLPEFVFM